jgi:predicted amidophosphoribosyltransferase
MEGMQANPAQIKKYLKQLTNSREQYINYLGQLAYQEYRDGNLPNPKLQEACSTLDEVASQVTKWEQDLATIEQMKQAARNPRCAYCGVPLSKGAPYCASCGQPATPMAVAPAPAAPMPAAPAPAPSAGKACASCGGALSSDATFCTFCGQPVAADVAPQQPAAPMPAVAAPAPVPVPATAPAEAAASGPLTCSSCGKSYDDPDALFCTDCGNKMR